MSRSPCWLVSTSAASRRPASRARAPARCIRRRGRRGGRDHRRRPRPRRRRAPRATRSGSTATSSTRSRSRAPRSAAALERLDPALRAALELARDQIVAWHEAQRGATLVHDPLRRATSRRCVVPVDRAGCYVPGGRAPLASSVLMTALPARVAGVPHIALCTPPRPDGTVHDAILAAAELAGVDVVYRVGGAQAIAALAYGTETIAAVDVIVGPGNAYVAEAKRQVAADVGIDGLRGAVGGRDRRRRADAAGAGRGRPARAGRARTGRRRRADHLGRGARRRGRARARHAARGAPARDDGTEADAARRRPARARRRARAGDRTPPTRSRPSTSSSCAPTRSSSCRSCATRARCSSAPTRPR